VSDQATIERRFRGPSQSANGGYAAGVLAEYVAGSPAVEVTLRAPPPLDRPLRIDRDGEAASMSDGDVLVAEAKPAAGPALALPDPIGLDQAQLASRESFMRTDHPFPQCFVCGPDREGGDGLGIVCGAVDGGGRVAAPWAAGAEPAGDGSVDPKLIWSALDCPSGIAAMAVPGVGVSMLGRLTATIPEPIEPGQTLIAVGWPIERDGRKLFAGSGIFDQGGKPLAVARATWIEVRAQPA
jgi:hypothetical protein